MAKEDKATKIQAEQRVTVVYQLLICGASRSDVFRYVSELRQKHIDNAIDHPDPWNISERQIENYISAANKRFEEAAIIHRPRVFGRAIARREDLYQRALRLQDLGKALAVEQDLAKLCDLYTPDSKAAHLAAQVALLENKLEELQKREVLLAFLQKSATPEVYQEVLRLLTGGPQSGGATTVIDLAFEDTPRQEDPASSEAPSTPE